MADHSRVKKNVRFADRGLTRRGDAPPPGRNHVAELAKTIFALDVLGPHVNMVDFRKTPPSSKGSLFTNFEDVQLTDEERLYLNAAALGDTAIIRTSLDDNEVTLNVNCLDYMGRNALHLAVDSEVMESIEILLDRLNFECIEEALLHAISKGATKIVKVIIEHPNYIAGDENIRRSGVRDPFFRTEEKSQFSPDVTPIILAAHYNNHEIIQMFLSRNHTIEKPHPISCQCHDCVTKQNYDSLKRSRSRLNAYRALASPAYMALSSPDPIMTTFELRQEMKKLAQTEKEFKNEYLSLVEQCMEFACELMDLCRGTQEVEAVLSEGSDENSTRDPLARLKMAVEYEEKKFVAHPNCQQHLTSIWFGPELGFMQSLSFWKMILMWIVIVPLVPFICVVYIISPDSKWGSALRCPCAKFITHTVSHLTFLILLAAATFRLDEKTIIISSGLNLSSPHEDMTEEARLESILKGTFRPANTLMTNVQICLMFWIFGLLWTECKQLYSSGIREYLLDNYNAIDFLVLSLYLASYALRFLVDHWVKEADKYYDAFHVGISTARNALFDNNMTRFEEIMNRVFNDTSKPTYSYFMRASRFEWTSNDPEIVSDVLFAVANVVSIARTTYLMPAFEVLGPLQISLGRMVGDITRFLVLFFLVLFAFMVGLHNLYWYYGSQTYPVKTEFGDEKFIHSSEAFQGLPHTLYSLFWSMFGLVSIDQVEILYPNKKKESPYKYTFPFGNHATSIVEGVGMMLFAIYHVAVIIVLINMLIAMMSHSFEDIQTDCDVEWKFARTCLWMNYIDEGSTLPVPFNMIPTPKSFRYIYSAVREMMCCAAQEGLLELENIRRQNFIKKRKSDGQVFASFFSKTRRENVCHNLNIEAPETNYADILQRLVRRYLFKLERLKEEGKDAVNLGPDSLLGGATAELHSSSIPEEPMFADEGRDDPRAMSSLSTPSSKSPEKLRRKASIRGKQAQKTRRLSIQPNQPQVQLLSIPQLDAIQRSLKLLDVRLQHIQSKARDDEKTKDDISHIRVVMSENQKAMSSVVSVLASIQEEVRALSITVYKQQQNTLTLQPPIKKRDNRLTSVSSLATAELRHHERERDKEVRSALHMDLSEI